MHVQSARHGRFARAVSHRRATYLRRVATVAVNSVVRFSARTGLAVVAAASIISGCAHPIDTASQQAATTTGEDIYTILCDRMAADRYPGDLAGLRTRDACRQGVPLPDDAGAALWTLHQSRDRLIGALNDAFHPNYDPTLGSQLRDLLDAMLPLYDQQLVQPQVRGMADWVGSLKDHGQALQAMARMGQRDAYRPLTHTLGLLDPLLRYPDLHNFNGVFLAQVAPGGPARGAWEQLLTATTIELKQARSWLDPAWATTYKPVHDLLLTTHPHISDGTPRYVVRRGPDGLALTAVDGNGAVAPPFVDANDDGQADVTRGGRPVSAEGQVIARPFDAPAPAPANPNTPIAAAGRDAYGRLHDATGRLLYQYIDTSSTVAGGIIHEARALIAKRPHAAFDLLRPLTNLLGDETEHTTSPGLEGPDSTFTFSGPDAATSPLLDLVHGLSLVGHTDAAYWLLRLNDVLLRDYPQRLAPTAELAFQIADWLDEPEFEGLKLERNSTLADELLHVVSQMAAVPGLFESLLEVGQHPNMPSLGRLIAQHMRHTDLISYDPADVNAPVVGGFDTPVNRNQPDRGSNRSMMQRLLHLVHDVNGARMCNKAGATMHVGGFQYPMGGEPFGECDLMDIPNMAVFYMESIAGVAKLPIKDPMVNGLNSIADVLTDGLIDPMQELSGILGLTTSPTPRAIHRMIFAPRNQFLQDLVDPPVGIDGVSLEERHPGTLFVWELGGFVDMMKPVAEAFVKHGATKLLPDLMTVLHKHYASPANDTTQSGDPNALVYSAKTGLVRFEELIARTLDEGNAIQIASDLLRTTTSLHIEGRAGGDMLAKFGRHLLLVNREYNRGGVRYRNGSRRGVMGDGRTVVRKPTPAHVLLDAWRKIDARLDLDGPDGDAFSQSAETLLRQIFGTRNLSTYRMFANRRTMPMLEAFNRFALGRMEHHRTLGTSDTWAAGWTDDVHDVLGHPITLSALRLSHQVSDDLAARHAMANLGQYLLQPQPSAHGHGAGVADNDSDNGALAPLDALLMDTVDVIQALRDRETLAPLLQAMAPAAHPETGVVLTTGDLMAALHSMDNKRVATRLLQSLVHPASDGSGDRVLEVLGDIAKQVNRLQPGKQEALDADDWRGFLTAVEDFLRDDQTGMERMFTLIEHRQRP